MKILVTGAQGFIGKNLIAELNSRHGQEVLAYDRDTRPELLEEYAGQCDFVCHLAGVNRPEREEEFAESNFVFTATLLNSLTKQNNAVPVLLASSIQAVLDNPYGKSKKAGEDLLFDYGRQTGAKVLVYRLANVFGKWCRPNYNSVVATFCNNIAFDLPIQVKDPEVMLKLVYIDDVVAEFISAFTGEGNIGADGFYSVNAVHTARVGQIAALIQSFKENRVDRGLPDLADVFAKKLFSTYLSYLPPTSFAYPLRMNVDQRGSFTEFIKTPDRGQVSINISKPGITKGNHWHHTKVEKFLVVSGSGLIRFRKIGETEIVEYSVSSDALEVVDIPPGYTHSITNTGDTDLVTIIWANEFFDPGRPDTYYAEV